MVGLTLGDVSEPNWVKPEFKYSPFPKLKKFSWAPRNFVPLGLYKRKGLYEVPNESMGCTSCKPARISVQNKSQWPHLLLRLLKQNGTITV